MRSSQPGGRRASRFATDQASADGARRESVRRSSSARLSRDPEAAKDTQGDEALSGREMLDIIRETLERLPMLQRDAFVLIRFEGLSVSEAAQILGATEAAVKVRAFRAYEALRAALGSQGAEDSGPVDGRANPGGRR